MLVLSLTIIHSSFKTNNHPCNSSWTDCLHSLSDKRAWRVAWLKVLFHHKNLTIQETLILRKTKRTKLTPYDRDHVCRGWPRMDHQIHFIVFIHTQSPYNGVNMTKSCMQYHYLPHLVAAFSCWLLYQGPLLHGYYNRITTLNQQVRYNLGLL